MNINLFITWISPTERRIEGLILGVCINAIKGEFRYRKRGNDHRHYRRRNLTGMNEGGN